MHYYTWHIGDFLRDTSHLSPTQECFYRRLLDAYYRTEKPLPREASAVSRLAKASNLYEKKAVASVLKEFFQREADGYHNKRADAEIAKYKAKSGARAEAANARWNKKHSADSMQLHPTPDANAFPPISHSPITKNQEKQKTAEGERGNGSGRAARSPPPTRLPVDFKLTPERRAYAVDRGVDADLAFEMFKAHGIADGKTKADWDKAWEFWVLGDAKENRPKKTRYEQLMDPLKAQIARGEVTAVEHMARENPEMTDEEISQSENVPVERVREIRSAM